MTCGDYSDAPGTSTDWRLWLRRCGDRRVDVLQRVDHHARVEACECEVASALSHRASSITLLHERRDLLREVLLVEGWHDETRFLWDHPFNVSVDVVRDRRDLRELGLRDRAGESFAARGVGEDVEGVDQLRDSRRGNQAGQDEAVAQVHRRDALLELRAKDAVADPDEP